MIITRTPLRISFVGGGSDLPWFFHEEPGACVAASIDKYVYITQSKSFDGKYHVAYSSIEHGAINDIKHDLVREAIKSATFGGPALEIHSIADVPAGTGLGSSSSFAVGLIQGLYPSLSRAQLFQAAVGLEVGLCKRNIGLQDHLVAAHGGVNLYGFGPLPLGPRISPLECDYQLLNDHLLMFYTGSARTGDAGEVLASQGQTREDVRELAGMAEPFAKALVAGEMRMCGIVMDAAWTIKARYASTPQIDLWFTKAKWEGAWGGKLCGAGGGGFLLFMAPPSSHSRIEAALGLPRLKFRVGVEGSKVLYHG